MFGVIADAPVEPILPGIDAREHGTAREQLEGRAHREALVRTMTRETSVQRVEERNTETSAALGLDAGEFVAWSEADRAPLAAPTQEAAQPPSSKVRAC